MKKLSGLFTALLLGLGIVIVITGCNAGTKLKESRSEAYLIQKLYSPDWRRVNGTINNLVDWYPNSTNAIPPLKELLHRNTLGTNVVSDSRPPQFLSRKAARALAAYHADMSAEDMQVVYNFLESPDVETRMDGLKALRVFNKPEAVPYILPLLKDPNRHVLRDACQTLAVIGDKSVVPSIEPLLKHPDREVRKDAQRAIDALNSK